ncbi:MAG TPA: PspC domain-containing protein [Dictyoglomaceae bacterium]|nr:PspC domain-containing protein [Dictyoglomaceae bacterium]HOL39833.1 PspC domain-containing protein [Dictyoglomaceae bacterium]HOP94431.1 PspC domain-containing protein [Dictyoglomaceae bacterium]HPP16311.1 PspC domain-containing protein [Dictyoglomaceae bacterium]HPU43560.1 PspC domain-containing protein [Dictyoglomaceae bacterium]
MGKRLYRSKKNRVIFGVLGGIGEYFDIDPTVVRLIAILLLIPLGLVLPIIYFLAAMVIPEAPSDSNTESSDDIKPSGPIQHL